MRIGGWTVGTGDPAETDAPDEHALPAGTRGRRGPSVPPAAPARLPIRASRYAQLAGKRGAGAGTATTPEFPAEPTMQLARSTVGTRIRNLTSDGQNLRDIALTLGVTVAMVDEVEHRCRSDRPQQLPAVCHGRDGMGPGVHRGLGIGAAHAARRQRSHNGRAALPELHRRQRWRRGRETRGNPRLVAPAR
jgi:hypothetical protein